MGEVINGTVVAANPPVPLEGDLMVYGDAACTQPAPENLDFGKFPFTPCGGICAPKKHSVWAWNESNYPMMLMVELDHSDLFLCPETRELAGKEIAEGEIVEVVLGVCISVPTNGQEIDFTLTVRGDPIGAPK